MLSRVHKIKPATYSHNGKSMYIDSYKIDQVYMMASRKKIPPTQTLFKL